MPDQAPDIEPGKGKLVYDKKRRTIVAVPQNNEQRYFDVLKRIRNYMTTEQIRRDTKNIGLDYEEYLEMSYDNIRAEAERAIKGRRRPK
jgi:hypothetical protein